MTIVRTRAPSGEAILILPDAEFERLRELAEDMLDTRNLDASERRLVVGEEELLCEDDLAALRRAPSPSPSGGSGVALPPTRSRDFARPSPAC